MPSKALLCQRVCPAIPAGAYTFQITITKTYNNTNLFEDIKALYRMAGVKGQRVAFIFSDAEVKDEGFLEYINQILMTGEVAGLFAKDELDSIVNDVRPAMKLQSPGEPACPSQQAWAAICKLLNTTICIRLLASWRHSWVPSEWIRDRCSG